MALTKFFLKNKDFGVEYTSMKASKKKTHPIYTFIDDKGTFTVKNPHQYQTYFPLTNSKGSILSSISPNLGGDIKKNNDQFLTPPVSIEDIRSNLLCRRDFFIKTDKETIRASLPYENDVLEAGLLYHKLIKKIGTLTLEIINFIPHNLGLEVMWVKVKNTGKKAISITPTSFIPLYGRSEKNLRDHRHTSSLLNRVELNSYGIILTPTMIFDERGHRLNKTHYYVLGYEDNAALPLGQFPTLDYFCGKGDLLSPDAIEKNLMPVKKSNSSFSGKEACAALRFKSRKLNPGQEINYVLLLGLEDDKKKIKNNFTKLNTPQKVEQSLQATKKYWQDYLNQLDFDFQNKDLNNWLRWVKLQPTLRKLFGCSFLPHFDYGKGGRGWRDLWQDTLTLLLTDPAKVKNSIISNFKGVRIDGSNATIITKEDGLISDRNRISRVWMDHGVWPYLTLRLYIHRSSDIDILLKNVSYFRDHQLKRAQEIDTSFSQKDWNLRTKEDKIYEGSILEHLLIQNLVQFFNVGNHNIIRLENADWNDGLDMAPDQGESVAFSFMYAHNLNDLVLLLERLKKKAPKVKLLKEISLLFDTISNPIDYEDFRQKQKILESYLNKTKKIDGEKVSVSLKDIINDLKAKSDHLFKWLNQKEWLKQGFFNGYYDNKGKRVEGIHNKKIRMMLASQVFALMSGSVSKKHIEKVWKSINKHLKDKNHQGYRLNTDFKITYLDLGRAFGFSYGDKENGAFFSHMVVMLAYSLYQADFSMQGYQVLNSIYNMATDRKSQIYPVIPEYFNNEGKGLYLYLTGSASWYIYAMVEQVLGIKGLYGDLLLEPKLISQSFAKDSIKVKLPFAGKTLTVNFLRESKANKILKIRKVFLEGKPLAPQGNKCLIKRSTLVAQKKKNIHCQVSLG